MYKAASGISLVMMNKIFQLREESHYTSKFVMIHFTMTIALGIDSACDSTNRLF